MADTKETLVDEYMEAPPTGDIHHISREIFSEQVPNNHDNALDFLRSTGDDTFTYTDREAIKVRWKLVVTFILNFLDKGILSNASVFGLLKDAHLHGQQYSWVSTLFYFGYMIGQPISAYMIHKVPMSKWLTGNVFGWGVCILLGITASNFGALATSRFFLGVFESTVNPAFVLITAQYYTRNEHSLRACIWWSGASIGSFFGDLIAYGIGHVQGALSPWKYLFITFGSFTVLWSMAVLFLLPDSPWKMRFLSERERRIIVLRVAENHTGISTSAWKMSQAWSVLTDIQAWVFFAIAFLQSLPAGGLTAFNKLILTGLGFTNLEATIMSMPEHAIQLTSIIAAGIMGSYLKNSRCIVMILFNIPPLVGSFLIYYEPTSHMHTRLAGVYILLTNTISYIMVMSLVASNFAGMTRKLTVSAGIFLFYSAGNLTAPQLFLSAEAPRYSTGFRGMIASFLSMIVLEVFLMVYLVLENRRRDKKFGKVNPTKTQGHDFLDLTDKELPYFRYAW